MKVRAIGRFAELATPTFLTGQLFFELSFWPRAAVRDDQGLLARHAEVKRTVCCQSLSVRFTFRWFRCFWPCMGGVGVIFFSIARFAREKSYTYFSTLQLNLIPEKGGRDRLCPGRYGMAGGWGTGRPEFTFFFSRGGGGVGAAAGGLVPGSGEPFSKFRFGSSTRMGCPRATTEPDFRGRP